MTAAAWDLPTVSCIAARCSALAAAGGINLPTPGRQIGPGRSDAQQPISAALQRNSARACHPGLVARDAQPFFNAPVFPKFYAPVDEKGRTSRTERERRLYP
jgi:hypothetical protein